MYEKGRGVKQDDAAAVRWYRKAAEHGNADSKFYLGVMYANGRATPPQEAHWGELAERWAELDNEVTQLYRNGEYAEAVGVAEESVHVGEATVGDESPALASSLNLLALLYDKQGRYADAEPLLKRALAINEKALGPDHPNVAGR